MVVEMERLVGVVATVKHSCITFNECRKLNIKNPLFNANGGFFVLGEFVGERVG